MTYRPADMPWLSPYLMVTDADQASDFYEKAFNFTTLKKVPGTDGTTSHAEMSYKDQMIMLGKQGLYSKEVVCPKTSGQPSPVMLYVYCEDVDALFKQAIAAGAIVQLEPHAAHWGDRMCSMLDPDGHSWCFATHTPS